MKRRTFMGMMLAVPAAVASVGAPRLAAESVEAPVQPAVQFAKFERLDGTPVEFENLVAGDCFRRSDAPWLGDWMVTRSAKPCLPDGNYELLAVSIEPVKG